MADVALRANADRHHPGRHGHVQRRLSVLPHAVFENAGALERIICFMNTTDDPPVERLLMPGHGVAAAEYFAVDQNEKVLVLSDRHDAVLRRA